ncbi:APC family permease [Fodinicola acaciae]|uniref:APC family permease n=1 Tax=Fodinicola acaciae TaxID=2681555 RepID=UPI001C9E4798|nr:APC family permease [Fodinicola acaciae]
MTQTKMPSLRRGLRLREAVALGVGGTIGGGIFVLVGEGASAAGPGVLVAFALAFVASLAIALPYAELSCRFPLAGGGYAMTRAVLGDHWGFFMGWAFWGGYLFISGYVTVGFGGYLAGLTGLPPVAGSVLLIATSTVINLGGVTLSGRWQNIVILLGIAMLVVFAIAGIVTLRPTAITPFFPAGIAGVGAATLVTFLAFGGFDMVAAAGEEVVDPRRNLPRAIILTLLLVLGLYLAVALATVGALPAGELTGQAPLAAAARQVMGPAGGTLMTVASLLTTAATANAVLIVTSRISYAMARDRLLPGPLARVSASTRVPWVAIAVNGALFAVVAAVVSIPLAAKIGGFLYVLHFVFPLVVLIVVRRRATTDEAGFQVPLAKVVVPVAFLACAGLFVASGTTGLAGGTLWLAAGAVCYGIKRYFS